MRHILSAIRSALELKVWYGIGLPTWLATVLPGAVRISPLRVVPLALSFLVSLFNTAAGLVSRIVLARRIRRTALDPSPVIILGHWRTGTTYLHELLATDPRFITPTSYQCGAPRIHLVAETTFRPLMRLLLPARRPMDEMALDLDRPQEDEYAMLGLLGRSIYRTFIRPARGQLDGAYLSLRELSPEDRRDWIEAWLYFLKSVAVRHAECRPLLLKTPQHTARLRVILEVFPDARLVHVVRNPLDVYSSTLHTWRRLCDTQGLDRSGSAQPWLAETILANLEEMYRCFDEDRRAIPPGRLVEVRYEEIVADPKGTIARIYGTLGLGDPAGIAAALERRLAESSSYATNRHRLGPREIETVMHRWGHYIAAYGYGDAVAQALATARMSEDRSAPP